MSDKRESPPPSTRHELLSEIGRKLKLLRDDYEKARMYTQVDTLDYVTHYLVSGILNQESPSCVPSTMSEEEIEKLPIERQHAFRRYGVSKTCGYVNIQATQRAAYETALRDVIDGRVTLTAGVESDWLSKPLVTGFAYRERIRELEKELAQLRAKALAEG